MSWDAHPTSASVKKKRRYELKEPNVGVEPIGTAGRSVRAKALGDSSQPLQFGSNDGLGRVDREALQPGPRAVEGPNGRR